MKKKFYKTKSIDEAVYLVMNGFKYETMTIIPSAVKSCEWIFILTPSLKKASNNFWNTNVQVDLHRWMSVRQQLKYQRISEIQPSKTFQKNVRKNVTSEIRKHVNKDLTYYFKSETSKVLMKCSIGEGKVYDDSTHWKRYTAGNMFLDNQGLVKRP